MCAVEQETDCCVSFGITADLPSVTKAATTDWTAERYDWGKPPILLFCLFSTDNRPLILKINVWLIFSCTCSQMWLSRDPSALGTALLTHLCSVKLLVQTLWQQIQQIRQWFDFWESLDSGGRQPVWWHHHHLRLYFVNANITCASLNWMSKHWVNVSIKK